MDPHAHKTLQLRSVFRELKRAGGSALQAYYDFCNEGRDIISDPLAQQALKTARSEALQLTLGTPEGNATLDAQIRKHRLSSRAPWVLIGGPPCQAYSLVGRARNKGKSDYRPENDHRHFLYKEYLRIIHKYRPAVFVMENVKGILSSTVGGELVFHSILRDLSDPDLAVAGKRTRRGGYTIYSLSEEAMFDRKMALEDIDVRKFVVRTENYGIPQARHRVILLGVREDMDQPISHFLEKFQSKCPTLNDAIGSLPPLRSKLSKRKDSPDEWARVVRTHFSSLSQAATFSGQNGILAELQRGLIGVADSLSSGGLRVPKDPTCTLDSPLAEWLEDEHLQVWMNHEARGHMDSDLMRYAFASTFAKANGQSPKGHEDFNLSELLHPNHANWKSGKFSDRFRVQLLEKPSTTITSHISKDGHYFIHPDPSQCRSLTVREAARLQTFPDNYIFQGNRTQQYHQVGNAVPPLLAKKIAQIVRQLF